jgi:hypothetical protein
MSAMDFTRKSCGAENGAALRGHGGKTRVVAEQPRTKTRGAAKVPAVTKAEPGPGKNRVQPGAEAGTVDKSSGRTATAKAPADCSAAPVDDVKSVAELAAVILRDPDGRKKRLKVAESMRESGLDESKLAAMYGGLVEKLSRKKGDGAVGVAAAKLLLEVLKEAAHWLEPQKTAGINDSSDAPQFIRLIHNVPRPVRTE